MCGFPGEISADTRRKFAGWLSPLPHKLIGTLSFSAGKAKFVGNDLSTVLYFSKKIWYNVAGGVGSLLYKSKLFEVFDFCFVNHAVRFDYICKDKNAMYIANVLELVGSPAVLCYVG